MPEFELSTHARDMLKERNIPEEWVWRTLHTPHKKGRGDNNNMHYTKPIKERDGQMLHIVINANVYPNRIITIFFDRRLNRK